MDNISEALEQSRLSLSLVCIVEGSRYQNHCSCLMYLPPQLKIILLSFDLQKMFGQEVRTHPSMPLLVLLSNILIFLWGPSLLECLPSLTGWRPFIMPGALSLGMVGRLMVRG